MASIPQSKPKSKVIPMDATWESALNYLNERYVFVEQLAQVVRIPTIERPNLDIYSPAVFSGALESPLRVNKVPVARHWLNWPKRTTAYKLEYCPGQPRFYSNCLNTWMESPVKPIKGDCALFLDYLDRVFASDPTYRDWFLAWAAYPLQNPGAKLHTAVVFWSETTATGKSTFGKIMSHIYGASNYAQLDESTLHNPFNFWANGRQFIMGEEIRGASSEKHADRLKAMITQQVVYVNIKNKAQFELRDCLNYYFTSNHPNAFYIDSNDRRFFVHNLGSQKYPADKFRDEFLPWLENGGYEAIRFYLENEIDLSKPIVGGDPTTLNPHRFNPGSAAPQSKARSQMITANRDEAEEWVEELAINPIAALSETHRTLASAPELYQFFLKSCPKTRVPYKTFCTRLRARIDAVYCDNKVTLSSGAQIKLYPLAPHVGNVGDVGKPPTMLTLVSQYESERE